jgi:formate dehydrogenase maturation protein FdhE
MISAQCMHCGQEFEQKELSAKDWSVLVLSESCPECLTQLKTMGQEKREVLFAEKSFRFKQFAGELIEGESDVL